MANGNGNNLENNDSNVYKIDISIRVKEFLDFQINRQLIDLAKELLSIIDNNEEYIKKLENIIKETGVLEYNNYDRPNMNKDRKRVLDKSNNTIRNLQGLIEKLDINLKNE
mgnify:FL=1